MSRTAARAVPVGLVLIGSAVLLLAPTGGGGAFGAADACAQGQCPIANCEEHRLFICISDDPDKGDILRHACDLPSV